MFQRTAQMGWPQVRELASEFEPVLREKWPAYLEEIEGTTTIHLSLGSIND